MRAGGDKANAGGSLFSNVQRHISVINGSNQTLDSFTIPANSLNTIGDRIDVQAWGNIPASLPDANGNISIQITDDNGTRTIGSYSVAKDRDWYLEVTMLVETTGVSGNLDFAFRLFTFVTGGGVISLSQFVVGQVVAKLTGPVIVKLISFTTSSGTTPYATEYNMLCDFLPAG